MVRTGNALRGALLQLLERQAFDEITIRDICASARVGYATFFRHYPDKDVLLDDLASAAVAELLERALPILYAVDTRASCLELCRYVEERRKLWVALLTGGAAANMRQEFLRQARRVAALDEGNRPSWLPTDLAVVFGVSGVIEILAWWIQHRRSFSVEEIADVLDRLVIGPILEAPTRRRTPIRESE